MATASGVTGTAGDEHTLLRNSYDFATAMRTSAEEAVREFDLSLPQLTMIWALEAETAPASMRQLARTINCDPSNVTLLSDQLTKLGLAERRPHPSDGRQRVLTLTSKGRQVSARLQERLIATAPVFAALTLQEQRQLSRLHVKVITYIATH